VPTDLSQFDQYPFIKALDPAARPSPDPMAELTALATYFPQARGSFWFAAGLSFTSFALVDGVVVVSVQTGDGLQVALLGLARMALPRPQAALVSIELGLVARFSSKDGVLWMQAQLTDNSWLFFPDVRLTGGFAFVTWFTGPNRGQFVLTMGGFHPRFHRAGYPDVPRLGLQWRVSSAIAVKGEAYFALTSEAVMAGGRLEVSADFDPAWAHLVFGADGIIFFDPFHFEVEVYASIKAGVTIDVWIGEITISVSITGRVLVEGPKFHGRGDFRRRTGRHHRRVRWSQSARASESTVGGFRQEISRGSRARRRTRADGNPRQGLAAAGNGTRRRHRHGHRRWIDREAIRRLR
jgi:hypothetical protein